jgi:hypothetical protein
MKDILGQLLVEGDLVAYTQSGTTHIFTAKIVGFTAKMVKLEDLGGTSNDYNLKAPDRLLKITSQYKQFTKEYPEMLI